MTKCVQMTSPVEVIGLGSHVAASRLQKSKKKKKNTHIQSYCTDETLVKDKKKTKKKQMKENDKKKTAENLT